MGLGIWAGEWLQAGLWGLLAGGALVVGAAIAVATARHDESMAQVVDARKLIGTRKLPPGASPL